jgi:hypothetical protein
MKLSFITAIGVLECCALTASAQTYQRRANIVGGGRDFGRCSVEMIVDGAAEIQIRGDNGTVRNLRGQTPELRRFECSAPIPANPAEFRFNGTEGRGRQDLVKDPGDDGVAVIRIEDPEGGSDRYAFQLTWRSFGPMTRGGYPYEGNSGGDPGGGYHRFTRDQAIEACQNSVRGEAQQRYRTGDVTFRETRMDDQPGRSGWVLGTVETRRPGMPDQILKFSCSVNFDSGQIRSAQLDPLYSEGGPPAVSPTAVENCKRAVGARVSRDGYGGMDFGEVREEDRPGRADWVTGDLRATGPYGPERFRFSCNVDLRDGDVRSIDVSTRQR